MGNGADKMDEDKVTYAVIKCPYCGRYSTNVTIVSGGWNCHYCNHYNTESSALNKQVGGDHYKCFEVQPAYYYTKNKFGGLQSSIIKRISRYNQPTGKGLQDLEKIKHEVDLLIELEGWKNK